MKLRKKVTDTGYPVHTKSGKESVKWKKGHAIANKSMREKFGSKVAKRISKLVKQPPKGELLGKHTKKGEIIISKRVPKTKGNILRKAIAHHEKVEHKYMEGN